MNLSLNKKIALLSTSIAILLVAALIIGLFTAPASTPVDNTPPVQVPTELPPHQIANVPVSLQDTLMAGCETHACTSLLQTLGYDINEFQFADNYLDCHPVTEDPDTGIKIGPDMNSGFAGNAYAGYGIYAPAMTKCMNHYLSDVKSKQTAYLVENKTLDQLCAEYVMNDIPVMIWATTDMQEPIEWEAWKVDYVDENAKYKVGEIFKWMLHEHCLVLVGYDDDYYYFSDSVAGDISHFSRDVSEKRYEQLGWQAIVVK